MPHRLHFFTNRSTPLVTKAGERPEAKKGYGSLTRSRQATEGEERQIAQGKWVRVDSKGRKPSSPDYKMTSYRPKLAAKRAKALKGK